jgi:hypothetical protein
MLFIWIGAFLVIVGVLFTAAQAIWRGRLSEARPARFGAAGGTLEPRGANMGGFGLKANWPGLALMAVGGALLLAGAAGYSL